MHRKKNFISRGERISREKLFFKTSLSWIFIGVTFLVDVRSLELNRFSSKLFLQSTENGTWPRSTIYLKKHTCMFVDFDKLGCEVSSVLVSVVEGKQQFFRSYPIDWEETPFFLPTKPISFRVKNIRSEILLLKVSQRRENTIKA